MVIAIQVRRVSNVMGLGGSAAKKKNMIKKHYGSAGRKQASVCITVCFRSGSIGLTVLTTKPMSSWQATCSLGQLVMQHHNTVKF